MIVDIKASREALQPGMEFDSGGHQIIDPSGERPTTFIHCEGKNHGTHKNHFRFEFALKPDENYASIQSPESIKELVSPYLNVNKLKLKDQQFTNLTLLSRLNGELIIFLRLEMQLIKPPHSLVKG